jgi:hypothetical protein
VRGNEQRVEAASWSKKTHKKVIKQSLSNVMILLHQNKKRRGQGKNVTLETMMHSKPVKF